MEAAKRWVAQIEQDVNDQIIELNQMLQDEKETLIVENHELRNEIDALAAQVARLHKIIESFLVFAEPEEAAEARSVMNEAPSASLERLIAEKQAEALDKEADGFERDIEGSDTRKRLMYKRIVRVLRTAASDLRLKAQGEGQ